jgi:hypothetical protein
MNTYDTDASGSLAVPSSVQSHPAWFRLVDQLNWYDGKSQRCQRLYKWLKAVQVSAAVLIPISSLLPVEAVKCVTAIGGGIIAVLEAVQQMNQYSTLWVAYRATAERLKHEQYLFLSCAGPYKSKSEADSLVMLAERVEEYVSVEHANWYNEARHAAVPQKGNPAS